MQPGEITTYVAVRLGAIPPEREEECRAMLQVAPTFSICMEALGSVPWLIAERERILDATLTVLERGRRALDLLAGHPALNYEMVQILQGKHLEIAITHQAEIYDLLREISIDVTPDFIRQVDPLATGPAPVFIPPPPALPEPVAAAAGHPAPMDEPGEPKAESTHMLLDRIDDAGPMAVEELLRRGEEARRVAPPAAPDEPPAPGVPVPSEPPTGHVEGEPPPVIPPVPIEGPPTPPPYRLPTPDAKPMPQGLKIAGLAAALALGILSYLAFDGWQTESKFKNLLQAGEAALTKGDLPAAIAALDRASRMKPARRDVADRVHHARQIQDVMNKAEDAFVVNDSKAAVSWCDQALQLAPGLPRAVELRALAASNLKP